MSDVDDYNPYAELQFGYGWLAPTEDEQARRDAEAESGRLLAEQRRAENEFTARMRGQEAHTISEMFAGQVAAGQRAERRQRRQQHDADCGCGDCFEAENERKLAGVTRDPRPAPKPAFMVAKEAEEKAAEMKATPASKWDVAKATLGLKKLEKRVDNTASDVNTLETVVVDSWKNPHLYGH